MRARTFVFALVCGTATAALAQDGGYVRFPANSPDACALACASDQMCASWSFGSAARSYGQNRSNASTGGSSSGMCTFSGSSVVRNGPGFVSGLPRREAMSAPIPMTSAPPQQSFQGSNARQGGPNNGGSGWEVRPAPWLNNGGGAMQSAPQEPVRGMPQQLRPMPAPVPRDMPGAMPAMPSATPSPAPRIDYEPQAQPQQPQYARPPIGQSYTPPAPVYAPPVYAPPVYAPAPPSPMPNAPITRAPITSAPVTSAPLTSAPVTIAPPRPSLTRPQPRPQPQPQAQPQSAPQSPPMTMPAPPPGTRDIEADAMIYAPPIPFSTAPTVTPPRPRAARGTPKNRAPRPVASPAVTLPEVGGAASSGDAQVILPPRTVPVANPLSRGVPRSTSAATAVPAAASTGGAPPRQETAVRPAPGRGTPRTPVRDPSNPESFRGADGMIDAAEMRRAQLNAAREQGRPAYSVQREWEAVAAEGARAEAAGEVRVDPLAGTSPIPPPPETRAERRAREAEEAAETAAEARANANSDATEEEAAPPPRRPASRGARGVPRPKAPARTSQNGGVQQVADATPVRRAPQPRRAPAQALDREPRLSGGPG